MMRTNEPGVPGEKVEYNRMAQETSIKSPFQQSIDEVRYSRGYYAYGNTFDTSATGFVLPIRSTKTVRRYTLREECYEMLTSECDHAERIISIGNECPQIVYVRPGSKFSSKLCDVFTIRGAVIPPGDVVKLRFVVSAPEPRLCHRGDSYQCGSARFEKGNLVSVEYFDHARSWDVASADSGKFYTERSPSWADDIANNKVFAFLSEDFGMRSVYRHRKQGSEPEVDILECSSGHAVIMDGSVIHCQLRPGVRVLD